MLMTLVKEVLRLFVMRDSPKEYVSVQAYLDQHGIGTDAIIVSVEHHEENSDKYSSDDKASSDRYIYVQAYLEKHGLSADAISISSIE